METTLQDKISAAIKGFESSIHPLQMPEEQKQRIILKLIEAITKNHRA